MPIDQRQEEQRIRRNLNEKKLSNIVKAKIAGDRTILHDKQRIPKTQQNQLTSAIFANENIRQFSYLFSLPVRRNCNVNQRQAVQRIT